MPFSPFPSRLTLGNPSARDVACRRIDVPDVPSAAASTDAAPPCLIGTSAIATKLCSLTSCVLSSKEKPEGKSEARILLHSPVARAVTNRSATASHLHHVCTPQSKNHTA